MGTQLACFVLGATVGAVVALLFAPKSGRELREDLA
ncbi:MAG: YtxH domain-containing protein, partial [Acidobacteriota bacterium]|nr:YtxH domain-containing protein [Acidobacteriota bacterium]